MSSDVHVQDSKRELAAKVAEIGSTLCAYMPGHGNPELWPTSRCDCKYGATGIGEQNGCAEARTLHRMLTDPSAGPGLWGLHAVQKHGDALRRLADG